MVPVDQWAHFQENDEKIKLIKPWWDVAADYVAKGLLMVAVLAGVLQATTKSFVCIPVVECDQRLPALKTSKFCTGVYENSTNGTQVITLLVGLKDRRHYDFVESKCGRMQEFGMRETLWPVCLFLEVIVIIIFGNVWLKFPVISPIVDVFTSLIIECRNTQGTVKTLSDVLWLETPERDNDTPEVIEAKTLHQKVHQFRDDIKNNYFIYKTYLGVHGVCRFLVLWVAISINAIVFFPTTYELTCRMDDALFQDYSYFKCENGLYFNHTFTFAISSVLLVIYVFLAARSFFWSIRVREKLGEYDFEEYEQTQRRVEKGDLAFLLHLLYQSNKMFFLRIALFLSYRGNKNIRYQIFQQHRGRFSRRMRMRKNEEILLEPGAS